MTMKILVYGSLNIDLVFPVDHIVRPGETIAESAMIKSAGGKGANQAAALAKAGMEVYMAGKAGADGHFLLELLKSYGVNTDNVIIYPGATGQAIIQVDRSGQNSIVLYPGGNGEVKESEIAPALEAFGPGDAVLLQNEIPHGGRIINLAKERGMKVFFNPSPFDEKILALPLDKVDLLFVNEIEAAALAGEPLASEVFSAGEVLRPGERSGSVERSGTGPLLQILNKLCEKFPAAEIIITAGKEGAYYGANKGGGSEPSGGPQKIREKAEALEVPVVDSTGAGDTFTGFYIAAREKNYSLAQALSLACKAASLAVSRKGAMESMPFKDEVF